MSCYMRLSAVCPPRMQIWLPHKKSCLNSRRKLHVDGRARLSNEWAPSGGIAVSKDEDAHLKLIRAGFIRQSHSGIFQLLPLGLRVQDKIVGLVDRHMKGLGASRVQLSALSSESLWEQSGRLDKIGSELFRLQDRKEGRYLLSPTHEEEITTLVARSVQSYKHLPLRLYQITQKYRDELRPRHGLLRGRDFCMKDLYTFDYSVKAALTTYEAVREAYSQIFINEMKLPILVAKASSGDMGGDLSHEYHIPTALGEDQVMSCDSCDYVANEEVAECRPSSLPEAIVPAALRVWRAISKDRKTFINVWYAASSSSEEQMNTHAVKQVVPEVDPGVEDAEPLWAAAMDSTSDEKQLVNLFDFRVPDQVRRDLISGSADRLMPTDLLNHVGRISYAKLQTVPETNFLRIRDGDGCPSCTNGKLTVQKAIELGHTFHLGTRYSEPMKAFVAGPKRLLLNHGPESSPQQQANEEVPYQANTKVLMQMGCHGIGISRIIGAVANHLVDERGLNWPRVIAPYEVVIMYNTKEEALKSDADAVYDALNATGPHKQSPVDVILDDREDRLLGWKLKDADLVGYPVIVVLSKEWKASRRAEVQCRRLGVSELVALEDLKGRVESLLHRL